MVEAVVPGGWADLVPGRRDAMVFVYVALAALFLVVAAIQLRNRSGGR